MTDVNLDELVGGGIVPEFCRIWEKEEGPELEVFHDFGGYIGGFRYNQKEKTLYVDMVRSKLPAEIKEGEGILVAVMLPEGISAVKTGFVRMVNEKIHLPDLTRRDHPYLTEGVPQIRFE